MAFSDRIRKAHIDEATKPQGAEVMTLKVITYYVVLDVA